jgi:[ribosomal protein S5]-alanine N-acetyltransferase
MFLKMSDLETERLRLREFRPTDLTGVASWEGAPHAEKFLEFCFHSYREWGMGPWAMLLKQSGAIAGNCGFCRISYDRALATFEYCGEVNYYVAPQYRGQGLATEALKAVLKFGFADVRLTRIQGRCAPGNLSSERVMQKAGLKFERMIPGAEDNSPEDKLYAIMREAFKTLTSSSPSEPNQTHG